MHRKEGLVRFLSEVEMVFCQVPLSLFIGLEHYVG